MRFARSFFYAATPVLVIIATLPILITLHTLQQMKLKADSNGSVPDTL
jgi:hypothetical protein